MSDEGVEADVGSFSDQFPDIITVRLLDEVMQTLTQQTVHPDSTQDVFRFTGKVFKSKDGQNSSDDCGTTQTLE